MNFFKSMTGTWTEHPKGNRKIPNAPVTPMINAFIRFRLISIQMLTLSILNAF